MQVHLIHFSHPLLCDLSHKTGKLLTVSDSSFSLDMSRERERERERETFYLVTYIWISALRISGLSSRIYLFTIFTWRLLSNSLRNMFWAHFWRKSFQNWLYTLSKPRIGVLWTLRANINFFWYEILTFWDFKWDFKFLAKISNVLVTGYKPFRSADIGEFLFRVVKLFLGKKRLN